MMIPTALCRRRTSIPRHVDRLLEGGEAVPLQFHGKCVPRTLEDIWRWPSRDSAKMEFRHGWRAWFMGIFALTATNPKYVRHPGCPWFVEIGMKRSETYEDYSTSQSLNVNPDFRMMVTHPVETHPTTRRLTMCSDCWKTKLPVVGCQANKTWNGPSLMCPLRDLCRIQELCSANLRGRQLCPRVLTEQLNYEDSESSIKAYGV